VLVFFDFSGIRIRTRNPWVMGSNPDTAIFYEVVSLNYILFSFEEYKLTDGGLGNISKANIRFVEIRQFCRLQDEGQSLVRAAMTQLNLSARAYYRVLKLARTIADLAGSEDIQSAHLAEALQYRPKIMLG